MLFDKKIFFFRKKKKKKVQKDIDVDKIEGVLAL